MLSNKNKKLVLIITAGIILVFVFFPWIYGRVKNFAFRPTETVLQKGLSLGVPEEIGDLLEPEIVAENLNIPWEIEFLPTGELLITERPGNLVVLRRAERQIIPIPGVEHVGEGGLLGMALHPRFEQQPWIYFYLTTRETGRVSNKVIRYRWDGQGLSSRETIFDNIPGGAVHNGGRIAFGPDELLYITTGDAGNSRLAQDLNSLAGKILRLDDLGAIPHDNPFNSPIYSYGHRNPQGLVWDDQGRLWSVEHGRSGLLSGMDELNLVEMGGNYGWPTIEGDAVMPGMFEPIAHSGPDETWAPAGIAFWKGRLFFAGLRGTSLYEAQIGAGDEVLAIISHFRGDFGRLRAVRVGLDGFIYITTSNTDGRGASQPSDDKLIKIDPKKLISD